MVVPSFTRIGSVVRSRLDHWRAIEDYDVHGRVMVITGATSGIGRAAAHMLAGTGATIEVLARNERKAAAVVAELRSVAPGTDPGYVVADTGDLDAVRRAAEILRSRHDRIDVLIQNAGALDAEYHRAPSGIELTVASQVVGPFLLSSLLVDGLTAAAPGRIMWVTSGGMYTQPLNVEDLDPEPARYDGTVAYARAKRAQVTLVEMMAEHFDPTECVVHAMHPGWAATPGVARSLPTFGRIMGPLLRTPEQGADTLAWLACDDGEPVHTTGLLWHDRRPRPTHRRNLTSKADTLDERQRLWDWCVAKSGATVR